jgi:prolipoprotein diacylglyceryl transferase
VTYFLASIPSPPRGVWHLGPIALRAYALFIIVGIIVGVVWGSRRYVARGGRPGRIADLAVFAVPFGLVGGRLYHVITDHELYFGAGRNPWRAFAIWEGGLGIWGAVALGAVGIWLGCRHYKVPMAPVVDSLAPGLVLAQAIGRLGNYFNQELFGSPTTLPWGLQVFLRTPDGVAGSQTMCAAAGAAPEFPTDYLKATPEVLCGTYHPTFLYELIWNLLVLALIVWADRRFRLGGGRVFGLYVAAYTAGRAWIEALRIDPARTRVFGLRVNIVVSIVIFLLAIAFLLWRRTIGREDPAAVEGPERRSDPDRDQDRRQSAADESAADADADADAVDEGIPVTGTSADTGLDVEVTPDTDVNADPVVTADPEPARQPAADPAVADKNP